MIQEQLNYEILSPILDLLRTNKIDNVEKLKSYSDRQGNNILMKVIQDAARENLDVSSNLKHGENLVSLIEYLISLGVKIDQENAKGMISLEYATRFKLNTIANILVQNNSSLGNSLNIAYRNQDTKMLKSLLSMIPEQYRKEEIRKCYFDAYINRTSEDKFDIYGHQPIHTEIISNNMKDVEYIIATIDSPNTLTMVETRSPLHIICQKSERLHMLDIIITKRKELVSSVYGDNQTLDQLDVNIKDFEGNTPMHVLLRDLNITLENQSRVLRSIDLLCQNGADVTIKNDLGLTPINLAILRDLNKDMLKRLIEQGGDNIDLHQLLSFAQQNHNETAITILQEYINGLPYCIISREDILQDDHISRTLTSDKAVVNIPSDISIPKGDRYISQQNEACRLM
jgi:ankyrin repeat protein